MTVKFSTNSNVNVEDRAMTHLHGIDNDSEY
jgi:hypothetical protein